MSAERTLILQHGVGPHHLEMLVVGAKSLRAWAARHGVEVQILETRLAPERMPHWEKIAALQAACRISEDGRLIVYRDADTLQAGDEAPEAMLPAGFVAGMCGHRFVTDAAAARPRWWQTGVIAVRNCADVREWLSRAWALWPLPKNLADVHPMHDERALNAALVTGGGHRLLEVFELPPRWNCWGGNLAALDVEPVQIMAWHGMPRREALVRMRRFVDAAVVAQVAN